MRVSCDQMLKWNNQGYICMVVVAYDGPYGARGEIKSKHRTHAMAEKRCKGNDWLRIDYINDYLI